MRVPITTDFDSSIQSVLGGAEFTQEGLKRLYELIESGHVPMFGIGFVGEPDENGVYHNVELKEISMLTRPQNEREYEEIDNDNIG